MTIAKIAMKMTTTGRRRLLAPGWLALSSALWLAAPAASAQMMLPGQWSISSTIASSDGELEKTLAQARQQLASMAPEQRRQIEAMLARSGVTVGGSGAAVNQKVCLTRKMVEQNIVPLQQNGDCKSTNSKLTGNKMKLSFSCTTPPSSGSGEVTFISNTSYSMQLSASSSATGKPIQMNVSSQGKWLSATCSAGSQ